MSRHVSAANRRIDALAIALLVAGLAIYAYSWTGMRDVIAGKVVAAPGHRLVEKVDRLRTLGNIGLAVTIGGVAVGIVGMLRHSRRVVEPSS